MQEILRKRTESIAEKYAELIEKRLTMTLEDESDIFTAMEQIEGGIKMLGYLITALDRMNRISHGND